MKERKMQSEWLRAASLLETGGYTCVLCKDGEIHTSTRRGVAPLLAFLDSGTDFTDFYAADKVVGKGAAMLYVALGVRAVYGSVMSLCAKKYLEEHGIQLDCEQSPERIVNHEGTGFCPIESAVTEIESPQQGIEIIRKTLQNLSKKQ